MSAAPVGEVEILTVSDRRRWEHVDASGAMPSQCWRFAHALTHSGYEPRLAIVHAGGSRMLLPFAERQWSGATDIATLPGLSGASIAPASAEPLRYWHAFAARQGWVTGYIQLAPQNHPNVPPETDAPHRMYAFLINIADWDPTRSASPIIRRKIARARQQGVLVVDDRARLTPALQFLYPRMLTWFKARPPVGPETLARWAADTRNLLLGVSIDGSIEGVHLIQVHGGRAEFHIAGMSRRGRELSSLLYTAAIERLRTMGVTQCNLGGGGNPGDGLYTFKQWLGATPVPLQSVAQVYEPERYAALCRAAGVTGGATWFPAYRAAAASHGNG